MLPYSAEALSALYVRYLEAQWPLGAVVCLATLAALPMVVFAPAHATRLAGGLLALGWLWVGTAFHLGYLAAIHFAAPAYAGLFILQGLMLAWQGPVRRRLQLRWRPDAGGWIGLAIMLFATLVYPLLDHLDGRSGGGLRLVGLAPGPTAAFTLGLLLHGRGRSPAQLLILPVAWTLVAGFSGWVLGLAADQVLPMLPPLVALALSLRRRGATA